MCDNRSFLGMKVDVCRCLYQHITTICGLVEHLFRVLFSRP